MRSNLLLNGLRTWRIALAIAGLLLVVGVLGSQPTEGRQLGNESADGLQAAKEVGGKAGNPIVGRAARSDTSPPLRSMRPVQPGPMTDRHVEANENPVLPDYYTSRWVQDTVVQKIFAPLPAMPAPSQSFEGMYNYWGPVPPDTNGAVGLNHYVQIVNSGFQVFDKVGTPLYGPVDTNTLWSGFGGSCETRNDGDPVVLYDRLANRWNISQFTSASPYMQCIAVSTSGDPLGNWYRYAFQESTTVFGDYPKVSVWPDGYYMTVNQFGGASGGGNYAFERPRMLVGDPGARFVYFSTPNGGALPSDFDGTTPPPAGSPDFFLFPTSSSSGTLSEYKFHVDWTNPLSSTFTGPISIPVAPWNATICNAPRGQCIDQPNTTARLEAIADRLMFRLAYRNLGDHQALVVNHTVNITTTNPGLAGIRWYEIRDPNGTPSVYQQGTYTQPDNVHRWMGSIAMDHAGNIALGYSASSSVISPSIRYTGRLVADPLGTLSQGEQILIQGMGVEDFPAAPRWGDYSDMTVDPSDDCTFWYTTEYFAHVGNRNWRTRIGSFRYPNCTTGTTTPTATTVPTRTPTVTPTLCPGGATYVGSLTGSDPIQTGRLNASSPSICQLTRACPGVYTAESPPLPRHYDSYTYTNTLGAAQCVTVRISEACGDNHLRSTAYLDAFNPNSICQTYLADHGGVGSQTFSYSFTLPAGHSVIVVVYEGVSNLGCDAYTLNISPCAGIPTYTPTITLTPSITPTPYPTCGSGADYVLDMSTGATIDPGATLVAGSQCDDCITTITLPFTFNFYGVSRSTARLGSNGNIQFNSSNASASNACLPTASVNNAIMPYWDDIDLSVNPAYGIYTSTVGTAPNRVFNIEWRGVIFGTNTYVDFEVRLFEGQDNFEMVYGTLEDNGTGATVGVQRANGVSYTQYSCNAPLLQNGLRLAFHPLACGENTRTPTVTNTRTNTPTLTPAAILVGHVTWQGPPPQPNDLQQLPITLTLKLGTIEVNYPARNTDNYGFFTVSVSSLVAGTYNWRVKGPKYLANSGIVTLPGGSSTTNVEMGLMEAGDCNNDNIVNISDFNLLKGTFGKGQGDPNYDDRADFTGNHIVTVLDFNLLKTHVGQGGAPPIEQKRTAKTQRALSTSRFLLLILGVLSALCVFAVRQRET